MNFIQLTYVNIKRMLKEPSKVAFSLIFPLVIILFTNFINNGKNIKASPSNIQVAYNIEDESQIVSELFQPSASSYIFLREKEKAMELLETNEVAVVYNIPSDFSEKIDNYEKPIIEAYKQEEGNVTIPIEMSINNKINEFIKEKLLVDKEIISNRDELYIIKTETTFERDKKVVSGDMHLVTMMVMYFIILGSSVIGPELITYKKNNILSRTITTPNNSATILGSLGLSLLVFEVLLDTIVYTVAIKILGYEIVNLGLVFISIVLANMYTIVLSLVITRVFNNEGIASFITTILSVIILVLSIYANIESSEIPKILINLGKFTPLYWIFDSLEKSIIYPNVFLVLLMILALFTAGSYRLKDFVKK